MMIVPGMHRPWLAAVSVLGLVGSLLAVGAGPAGGTAGVSDNEAIYSACVGPALESVGLVDVEGSFAEDAVNCLAHYGVTRGRTATTYDPGSPVLRWQMALFLSRAAGPAGIALPANPADGFTDIGGLFESARTAINQMAALDIMLGLRGTEFGPNTLVSRAQMALMLDSFLVAAEKGAGLGLGALGPDADELADVDPDDDMFGDIDSVTRSEYSAIRRMFELGVTRGTSDGQFSPRRLVTRAQMAVFIARMLAHTVARPAGLTVQASKSSVAEDEPVMLAVSVRDSGLMAVPGSLVDVFSSSAPDDAFGSDGRCSGNGVSAVGGSGVCEIALGDKATDASGDLELTADGLASTTIWAWTGEVGDQYDTDDTVGSSLRITAAKPGVRLRVTDDMPEGANSVEFGERVVFTLQVVDEDGNSVAKKDESVIVAAAVTITTGGDNDSSSSTLAHKTDASGKIELAFRQTDPRSGNPGDSARLDLDVSLASGSSLVLEDQSTLGKAGSDGSAEGDAAVLWREAASAAPATATTTTVAAPAAALPPDPDGIYTGDPLQLIAHAEFTGSSEMRGEWLAERGRGIHGIWGGVLHNRTLKNASRERRTPVECKHKRICEVMAGLGDVEILEASEPLDGALLVEVRTVGTARPSCPGCGGRVWSKGERLVELVDLPAFGRPVRLAWRKHRRECPDSACGAGSFTEQDPRIAPERGLLTSRAARWAAEMVGREGRTVSAVARELGCDWHTVNKEVIRWGQALLEADEDRIGAVEAIGVDETMFLRTAPRRRPQKRWCTSIVDVEAGQLLDIVPGREALGPARWLQARPRAWREQIRWAVLDLSGPYRAAYNAAIPHATQVADPFHVVRLANNRLDEVRRRVQNQTVGHRGRKDDPLYRIRKLLTLAQERLNPAGGERLQGLLAAGDPYGEVRLAWHAKETLRDVYQIQDPGLADEYTRRLAADLQDQSCPPEVNQLGRAIARWYDQIVAWHRSRVSNGPTEAVNNLIKRIKRIGFGFRNFTNYRIRALLYAGKPNWDLLPSVTPPSFPKSQFTRAYTLPGSAGDRFDVWLCNTPSVRYYSENPDIRHNPSNYADKFHSQVSPWFRWLSGGLYAPMFRPGGVVTVGLSFDYYQSCYREVLDRYPGGGTDTDGAVIVVGSRARYDGPLGQGSCGLFSQRAFPGNHRAVLVNGSAFTDPTVLAHEMGHALCWPHSFSGETEYRGEVWEYDNPMDIMGWSSSVQSAPVPGLGTHAVNRYAAGWIPPSQVAVHTPGTTARYTLEPIGGDGLQMLIVPYEADDRLSYRALGVRVRGEGDLWWADEDIVEEGVEIYHINQTVYGCDLPDRGYCYGLDRRTRPLFDRDDGYEARDAAHVMQPDDAWYWRDGDEIEVISRDGDSFVVEVRPYTE